MINESGPAAVGWLAGWLTVWPELIFKHSGKILVFNFQKKHFNYENFTSKLTSIESQPLKHFLIMFYFCCERNLKMINVKCHFKLNSIMSFIIIALIV